MEFLPGFSFRDRELGRRITLRHLLSHTSGLPSAGKDWGPRDRDALQRFVWDQLARYSLVAEPGRVLRYTNTGITLAGYVAEIVTGTPYRDLVAELVTTPLRMERTTFDHAVAMTYPLALPHEEGPDGRLRVVHRWSDNLAGEPAGFLMSTALDLANLAMVLLNAGQFRGAPFLSAGAVAEMQRTVVAIPKLGATHPFAFMNGGYGLGLWTGTYAAERVVRHSGVSQSFNSFFDLLPDRRRGFVLLSNFDRGLPLLELVVRLYDYLLDRPDRKLFMLDPLPPPMDETYRATWPRHEGAYLNVERGILVEITMRDDLIATVNGSEHALIPMSATEYYFPDPEEGRLLVAFVPETEGPTEYLYFAAAPYRRITLDPAFIPDPSSWDRYVGTYRDRTNLDSAWTIQIRREDDQLILTGDGEDEVCRPLGQVTFLSSWGLIEFVVEDDGNVTALVLGKATRYGRVARGGSSVIGSAEQGGS